MADIDLPTLEAELDDLLREQKLARAAREVLGETHRRIEEDLQQGYGMYKYTVGGSEADYAKWHRRATKMRDNTEKRWAKLNKKILEMNDRERAVRDLIRVHRSGWRDNDTMSILTALLTDLESSPIAQQAIQPDLLFAARMHAGLEKP